MRYAVSWFDYPELKAQVYIAGPQDESQVPQEIRTLLGEKYVTQVIIFRDIDGRKCGQAFNKTVEAI